MTDDEVYAAIRTNGFPREFNHKDHVHVAYCLIKNKFLRPFATEIFRSVVEGWARKHSLPSPYDQRITDAWIAKVAVAIASSNPYGFEDLWDSNPQLHDKRST